MRIDNTPGCLLHPHFMNLTLLRQASEGAQA
jgi:hypothetical protein